MKQQLIIATTVTALLAGTSLVSAQRGPDSSPSAPPAASPANPASPATPAEKMAPGSKATSPDNRTNSDSRGTPDSGKNASDTRGPDGKATQQGSTPQQNRATQSENGSPSRAQAPSRTPSNERNASGGSQTNVNVNLSGDQRTRIRETVVKESNAPRISRREATFNLSVGTVVPRTVRVAVLPAAVVEIHPAWRGYSYILVGDEIVILEPGSLRIVAIIPA